MKNSEFEPIILTFCCNWCAYAAADLAGVSRFHYPHNIRIIRVMCSGMIHPNLVVNALTKGADGVIICGCHIGDCHYKEGNIRAKQRVEGINLMLEDLGLEPQRFKFEHVSASEGEKFARIIREFVEEIKKLGPNPFKP